MTSTPDTNIGEDEHWRYMQENHLDWLGKWKYKNIDEWRQAKKKDAEDTKRQEEIDKLKKAAMLGIEQ